MIGVIAKLSIKEGKQEEFEKVALDLMAKVNANEPGCITYKLYKSKSSDTEYTFLEQYESQDALKAHGQSDHFKAAQAGLGACLAGAPSIEYLDSVD